MCGAVVTDADPNSKLAKEAAESSASLADVSPSERPQRRQRKVPSWPRAAEMQCVHDTAIQAS